MNARKEAIEIYDKFRNAEPVLQANVKSKNRAIMAVELIIQSNPSTVVQHEMYGEPYMEEIVSNVSYWEDVLNHLKKL